MPSEVASDRAETCVSRRRRGSGGARSAMPAELRAVVRLLGKLTWQQEAVAAAAWREDPAGVEACVRLALGGKQPRSLFKSLLTQGLHRQSPTVEPRARARSPIRLANEDCTSCGATATVVTVGR